MDWGYNLGVGTLFKVEDPEKKIKNKNLQKEEQEGGNLSQN